MTHLEQQLVPAVSSGHPHLLPAAARERPQISWGEQVEVGPPSVSAICKNAKLQYSSSLFCLARKGVLGAQYPPGSY